jgi:hypothetical protein
MGDLDTATWIDAAQSYRRLRRRFFGCFLTAAALASALILVRSLDLELDRHLRRLLLSLLAVGLCACWTVALVTRIQLIRFGCPGCGKRFALSWWSSQATDRCKHCSLDLGQAAVAAAKPPAVVDL